ncbi:hypothetical protein D0T50_12990 [Bacteroides sp. 214]|uniref:hypothetical protein n=1 Tax=Bacteroides sp. 214 TaxID=2302935 RepID=UPI0013D01D3A|nr:hypothetical protein [Bacteroides sp. 214]NDW13797.1 hypothetical protein [Bacteroides sp. 214]
MTYKMNKEKYLSPAIEVIEVENEGVIAGSPGGGNVDDFGSGGDWNYSSSSTRSRKSIHQSASASQEWEDLINDILT